MVGAGWAPPPDLAPSLPAPAAASHHAWHSGVPGGATAAGGCRTTVRGCHWMPVGAILHRPRSRDRPPPRHPHPRARARAACFARAHPGACTVLQLLSPRCVGAKGKRWGCVCRILRGTPPPPSVLPSLACCSGVSRFEDVLVAVNNRDVTHPGAVSAVLAFMQNLAAKVSGLPFGVRVLQWGRPRRPATGGGCTATLPFARPPLPLRVGCHCGCPSAAVLPSLFCLEQSADAVLV
jgi:hypothetical protein